MATIIDIKPVLKTSDVLTILAESMYMPTEEKLKKRADDFISNINVAACGYNDKNAILGLIILDTTKKEEIVILNISVSKDKRYTGIGRKLIQYVLSNLKPRILVAETDDEAVNFYRKCGFIIKSLDEKYPNTIRYECRYFC